MAEAEGYRLLQTLSVDRTYLCADASANVVVLKRLDDDCLPGQKLHPQIRDRLMRVRELAHPHIATLRTVERWNGVFCLVWTYLDGETLEDFAARSDRILYLIVSVISTVDALHETGIVHGNIHGRNIIVRPGGQVWLTDVSPYLYVDPAVDITAVRNLVMVMARQLPAAQFAAASVVLNENLSLKELSRAVTAIGTERVAESISGAPSASPRFRTTSLTVAAVVAVLGVGCWAAIRWALLKPASVDPAPFPSLRLVARP